MFRVAAFVESAAATVSEAPDTLGDGGQSKHWSDRVKRGSEASNEPPSRAVGPFQSRPNRFPSVFIA
ncbi:hypothetical protein BRD01_07740 [Halobacteriales archaeon QS_8_65_32]|nr:MAG: hypothetical protein BRD01_07740 [Halobacteriales archaeon QS_8_65_32]